MSRRDAREETARCLGCGQAADPGRRYCPMCDGSMLQLTVSEAMPRAGGAPRPLEAFAPDDRYEILDRLGAGGMGTVHLAFDRLLRRQVAYKVLHESIAVSPEEVERFISECQATAQLQHPSIVPVYDMGVRLGDRRVYYTMKAIRGETLKALLDRRRDEAAAGGTAALTRFRVLQLLHQVCLTIAYTHSRRVLHRDLKPQNVMVGEFGEVYVMDFGLVKVLGGEVSTVRSALGESTEAVTVRGTLAYMPPEQAVSPDSVDEASDQFALGAMLYEALTGRAPYVGSPQDAWRAAITASFPRPRELDASIPPLLEQICLTSMNLERTHRFASVTDMAERIQEYLDGEKELSRRATLAAELLAKAQETLATYEEIEREVASLEREIARHSRGLPLRPSPEEKQRLQTLQERRERMAQERDRCFADAIRKLVHTSDVAPDNRRAKESIADLCYRKMIDLEEAGRLGEMASYRALVESYHEGKYARELQGDGALRVASDPPGAHAYLATFVRRGARLSAEDEEYLGRTPVERPGIPMGSYLVSLRKEGRPDVLHPVRIGRNERVVAEVAILAAPELAPGFVYVPAGPFLRGGVPIADREPPESVPLAAFCIGRNPVTMAEYLEFIQRLAADAGPEEALRRVPRVEATAGHYFLNDGATFRIPEVDTDGDRWDPIFPVFGISADDAEAYCEFRARRDGFAFRLPTSDEWEKAARGVDGRPFPWGLGWEEGLSRSITGDSSQHPEPIGRASDVGPYGVLGMTGNVQDWTSSVKPGHENLRRVRGGSFADGDSMAHLALEWYLRPSAVSTGVGFRMAYTPGPELAVR